MLTPERSWTRHYTERRSRIIDVRFSSTRFPKSNHRSKQRKQSEKYWPERTPELFLPPRILTECPLTPFSLFPPVNPISEFGFNTNPNGNDRNA